MSANPPAQEQETAPELSDGLLEAKKLVLNELGYSADQIANVDSQGADYLIEHAKNKQNAVPKQRPGLAPNRGTKPHAAKMAALPEPTDPVADKSRFNMCPEDRIDFISDPMHPGKEQRWNEGAHSLYLYDENGRPHLF